LAAAPPPPAKSGALSGRPGAVGSKVERSLSSSAKESYRTTPPRKIPPNDVQLPKSPPNWLIPPFVIPVALLLLVLARLSYRLQA
jgi:hypothetical protein